MPLPLVTDRLVLRPFRTEDAERVYAYRCLEEVARFVLWDAYTREQADESVTRWMAAREEVPLAVTLKDGGKLIGDCVLVHTDRSARQAEPGYILNPAFHRRGFGTELSFALLEYGFGELGLHRIFARCDARNEGSWRLMEKLGMRREAHFKEHALFKGDWDEELYYAILEDDWRARR